MEGIDVDAMKKELGSATDPKKLLELALKQAETDPEGMRKDIKLLDPTSTDTTRAITLKLGAEEFQPLVAYSIYTADYIRGYKKPKLLIEFDEVTLLPFVHFESEGKVNDDTPDAVSLLNKFMPKETIYEDRATWDARRKVERSQSLVSSIDPIGTLEGFEIRLLKFKSPEQTQFLNRLFTFCWFFIEGAQTPDSSDETWDVYVLTKADTGAFAGYASAYSFFYYLDGPSFELEAAKGATVRRRIAHFLILPPYQGQGVGTGFYLALIKRFIADTLVKEIEVEEPSASFENLRDRAHFSWLTSDPLAKELLEDYVLESEDALSKLRETYKMSAVQFQRVAEMHEFVENGNKETRALKKLIKSRLWEHNYEDLRDMDPATQRDQLQRVYENTLHGHKIALHLEEPSEDESEDEDDGPPTNPAEMLLAQLAQGMSSNIADRGGENI